MLAINMFKITGTRKQYPEDPAEFKPLTEDELQRIKKERRQKDLQRKQKAAENRKHLANVRVVQRNLVFVVGLSQRLADPEVLKKHEYFGKFGKIHKVVINHSTSYAGAQVRTGPSASAYVTYHKPEDALRAIQAVNNIYVDGRTLKASLGTTKYCSHFLRGAQCPKPDCMYLHELGEEAASFTKEEMQQGKHQEYEQKLYEGFMNSQNLSNHQTLPPPPSSTPSLTVPPCTTTSTSANSSNTSSSKAQRKKVSSPTTIQPVGGSNSSHPPPNTNKEAWPSLSSNGSSSGGNNSSGRPDRLTNGTKPTQSPASQSSSTSSLSSASSTSSTSSTSSSSSTHKQDVQNSQNRAPGHHRNSNSHTELHNSHSHSNSKKGSLGNTSCNATNPLSVQSPPASLQHHPALQPSPPLHQVSPPASSGAPPQQVQIPLGVVPPPTQSPIGTSRRSPFDTSDSMSLFSNSGFPMNRNPKPAVAPTHTTEGISTTEIPDTIPVSSTTDWSAAFGFSSSVTCPPMVEPHDDDLGFDPWDESSKALADLIEKESYTQCNNSHMMRDHSRLSGLMNNGSEQNRVKNLPPGFTPNHIGAYSNQLPRPGASKMGMPFAPMANVNSQNTYHDMLSDISLSSSMGGPTDNHTSHQNTQTDGFSNMKDWQAGLRALLPNINISFGAPTAPITHPNHQHPPHPQHQHQQQQHPQSQRPHTHKDWSSSCSSNSQLQSPTTDLPLDPAIVISGNITHSTNLSDDPPHWMASLHHLTEDTANHRLPFVHQFPFRGPTWAPQAHHPPPGFHQSHLSSPTQVAETHRLAEGLQ